MSIPDPSPQDTTQTERRLAAFGMSPDAAKTYAAFLSGRRSIASFPREDR
ncbi:hypothetical protein [Candidatus Solirubrobacter pratensis]|nr:hypothetical protein [Candidatus Solirubrobacter pratensis]